MIGGELKVARRGLMFILSSPSGAGKTTLANRLLKADPNVSLSISATTRAPRPMEKDGKHYFFMSESEFFAKRDAGEFLEWANVFGNYYATPKAHIDETLDAGGDVLFDIDWQGAQQLDAAKRDDVVKVFILPPSRIELERRLRERNQDPEEIVRGRMAKADAEMSHWAEYDYVIVNYDIEQSLTMLQAILLAERLKRRRQTGLASVVKDMMGER